jgi:hypothetical protein
MSPELTALVAATEANNALAGAPLAKSARRCRADVFGRLVVVWEGARSEPLATSA